MVLSSDLSVRRLLRDATAAAHAALDERMSPLLSGGDDRYGAFLIASAAAFFPIEQALVEAGVTTLLPDWPQRARTAALADDLEAMGVGPVPAEAPVPIPDEARLWGALYVLEGSRLGAQALLKTARAHPSARVRGATRYLAHGAGQGLWPSFLARLEAAPATARSGSARGAGAQSAFAQFDRALVLSLDAAPAPP